LIVDCDIPTEEDLLDVVTNNSGTVCTAAASLSADDPAGPDGCGEGLEVVNIRDAAGNVVTTVTGHNGNGNLQWSR